MSDRNAILEEVAAKLETIHGNAVYMSAWRRAARLIRGMKILKENPEILKDEPEQISSLSSLCR